MLWEFAPTDYKLHLNNQFDILENMLAVVSKTKMRKNYILFLETISTVKRKMRSKEQNGH